MLRRPPVHVMQPAEHRFGDDHARRPGSHGNGARRSVIEASVRAVLVVIPDEFIHDLLQMPLVEDKYMIQALPPQCAHEPLSDRIRLRRLRIPIQAGT